MFYSATTKGFYDPLIHDAMPTDAVEITDAAYQALMDGQAAGSVIAPDSNGHPVLQPSPTLTQDEAFQVGMVAIQNHIDSTAFSWGYGDYDGPGCCDRAMTYLTSGNVTWKAQAEALRNWRDSVWEAAFTIQGQVKAGTLPMPATTAALIAMLPAVPAKP